MLKQIISTLLISLVQLYKYIISPVIPKACRFLPTCSEYMIESIKIHGPFYGTFLGIKRILSCHPLSKKIGIDNVPPKTQRNKGL